MENWDLLSDLEPLHQSHHSYMPSSSLLAPINNNNKEINDPMSASPNSNIDKTFQMNHRFSSLNEYWNYDDSAVKESADYYLKNPSNDEPINFSDFPMNKQFSQNVFHFDPDNEDNESIHNDNSSLETLTDYELNDGYLLSKSSQRPRKKIRIMLNEWTDDETQELNDIQPINVGRFWTDTEKEILLRLAEQMQRENTFSVPELAKEYTKQYPGRSYSAVYRFASRLYQNTGINAAEIDKKIWTESEKQKLIQIANEMIKRGKFTYSGVGTQFSKQNKRHSAHAACQYTRKLEQLGEIIIPDDLNVKEYGIWTDSEKQQLMQLAAELNQNGTLTCTNLSRLFSEKNPHRSFNSVKSFANRLVKKQAARNNMHEC